MNNIAMMSFWNWWSRYSGLVQKPSRRAFRSRNSGMSRCSRSGIMKPRSRTTYSENKILYLGETFVIEVDRSLTWCGYPSPRRTFDMNWSKPLAAMWSRAIPTMHSAFRVVTRLLVLARWRTAVVEISSVSWKFKRFLDSELKFEIWQSKAIQLCSTFRKSLQMVRSWDKVSLLFVTIPQVCLR